VDVFGKAIVILCGGLFMRWLGTFVVTGGDQGFTVRERAFFAFSWIPKATVQAAIGGIVLDTARSLGGISEKNRERYQEYGNIVLTMAVISIILTAPTGAILINTLGEKWLSDDTVWELELKKKMMEGLGYKIGEKGDDEGAIPTERALRPSEAPTEKPERESKPNGVLEHKEENDHEIAENGKINGKGEEPSLPTQPNEQQIMTTNGEIELQDISLQRKMGRIDNI
jgi:hypothetical protein